jgi:hypothetical protein
VLLWHAHRIYVVPDGVSVDFEAHLKRQLHEFERPSSIQVIPLEQRIEASLASHLLFGPGTPVKSGLEIFEAFIQKWAERYPFVCLYFKISRPLLWNPYCQILDIVVVLI